MTRRLRVFIDSNILYSAAWKTPNPFEPYWTLPEVDILTREYSIREVSRNMPGEETRARLWQHLYQSHLVPDALEIPLPEEISWPSSDVPILLTALVNRANVLVPGDLRHFGPLFGSEIGGMTIESPAMFRNRFPQVLGTELLPR